MNIIYLSLVATFAVSGLICLASIPRALTIQHPGTRRGFVLFLSSIALWSGGYVGYLLVPSTRAKMAFYILGFVFAFVAVGAFLYFSSAYSGRPPERTPYRHGLIGAFLIFVVLKITNPLHNLYFTSEWTMEPFPHLAIHHGLLYWIVLGVSYAAIAVGFFMLIERFYHAGADSRPLVVLLALTALPAGATILSDQIPGLLPLMYEPPGVALFAVGTLFVYKERFEAIRLTSETEKPAIFLDRDGRIRDFNAEAQSIVPNLRGAIGQSIETVSEEFAVDVSETSVLPISEGDETRFYQIDSTPLTFGSVATGNLVTLNDVTDRESYRRRLEQRTEQLEALIRVVRHDIRNDMSVVVGWAEMLQSQVTGEEQEKALENILQQSRYVIELTDTAEDFVESISGESMGELKSVDLSQSIETGLVTVRNSYPEATFQVDGELPEVTVQANEMLPSVFRNLFENAVRHNDKQTPEITVFCEDRSDSVRVRIADNGPGIPEGRREEVFGKGQKGLDSPGTGIGLYLVHTLIDHFEGDVWIEDNDPEGAVFVIELQKA